MKLLKFPVYLLLFSFLTFLPEVSAPDFSSKSEFHKISRIFEGVDEFISRDTSAGKLPLELFLLSSEFDLSRNAKEFRPFFPLSENGPHSVQYSTTLPRGPPGHS